MSSTHWTNKLGEDGTLGGLGFPSLSHVMDTDWRDSARCAELPKSVFFEYNTQDGTVTTEQRRERKSLALTACSECPVIAQCYEFAICNNEKFGIWAGLTPDQRKPLVAKFKATGILESLPV